MGIGTERHDYDKNKGKNGGRVEWRLIIGTFFAMFFFSIFVLGVRAVHNLGAIPGDPTGPALVVGVVFMLFSYALMNANGGFLNWSYVVGFWIVGSLVNWLGGDKGKAINNRSDPFFHMLHFYTVLQMTLAMVVGIYAGGLTIWAFAGPVLLSFIEFTPGPWPGDNTAFTTLAFGMEAVAATTISFVIALAYLRNRAEFVPMLGGLGYGISTFLGFNISGPALDSAMWGAGGLAACTPEGNACFTGFADYGWVYLVGPLAFPLLGAALAYIATATAPLPDADDPTSEDSRKARKGKRHNKLEGDRADDGLIKGHAYEDDGVRSRNTTRDTVAPDDINDLVASHFDGN